MLIQANHIVDLSKVKRLSEDHLKIHKQAESHPVYMSVIDFLHSC